MTFLSELKSLLGVENIAENNLERLVYDHDYAPVPREIMIMFKNRPDAIVRTMSSDQVCEVLRIAHRYRVPVTPRGYATWAFGGAMPTRGGVTLDLTQLNHIEQYDEKRGLLKVQAGVVWKKAMDFLDSTKWQLPVYPSSAPSATVGGFAATGGLGYGSLRNGRLKDNVIQATVALPDGKVICLERDRETMEPIPRDGVTLDQLFSSEGILCIFLDLTIRLAPRGEVQAPVIASFYRFEDAAEALGAISKETAPFTLILNDGGFLRAKREAGFHTAGVPASGGVVLGQYSGDKGDVEKALDRFSEITVSHSGVVLPEEEAQLEWEERFYPLRVKRVGPTLVAADLLVPTSAVVKTTTYAQKLAGDAGIAVGMDVIAVGNDQTIILPMFFSDERKTLRFISHIALVKKLIDFTIGTGGRPYGYGVWNSFFVSRAEPERARELRSLKKKLDLNNILNPGKTLEAGTRFGLPLPGVIYNLSLGLMWALRKVF
mgnify:CR=1 FL=1